MKQTVYQLRRVVEYSSFFVGEPAINIRSTLKHYSRNRLIQIAAVLSHHYGNLSWPNSQHTLFSDISRKHLPYLNKLFNAYYVRLNLVQGEKVELLTYRTSLELWRQIFAIRIDDFCDDVKEEDAELLLFKVILSINEKILSFNERKDEYKLDELIFLNGFLTNDSNKYDFKAVMQPQMYYFHQLVDYIPSNEVLTQAVRVLFQNWGIKSWQEYFTTILCIAAKTDKYIKNQVSGVPVITSRWIALNTGSGILSESLINHLAIGEDAFIPHKDGADKELNIDYRRFRSCPLIKLRDGYGYIVINNQLLCERLFNSLYFDFVPLINGRKNSCGFFNYNKDFIEKILFRKTFFKCISSKCFTFPAKDADKSDEKPHEPDFYARTKYGDLIIAECKAIKMNGECRDDGDYVRLLEELHEKIVLKTRNLDQTRKQYKGEPEQIGVGQLIYHIVNIESDSFEWDTAISDNVCYYPLLVFEDVKLVQTGALSLINRWFYEEIEKEDKLDLPKTAIMPIMVVSINTLFLSNTLLKKIGLCRVIKSFVNKYSKYDSKTGKYDFSFGADFDAYLRQNACNHFGDETKWFHKLICSKKID